MIKTIYLAGRIEGLSYDEAVRLRNKAKKLFAKIGIKCLDPMRGKSSLKNVLRIDGSQGSKDMQEVITRDIDDINRSSAMVILTGDDPSWGTGMEASYCHFHLNKPYFVVSKNTSRYGWLRFLAAKVKPTIEELVDYIDKFWR